MSAAATAACAALALLAVAACLTAPPPDLPPTITHRPTILHGSVVPTSGILPDWPGTNSFDVPVEVYDPNQSFEWEVYVDYLPSSAGTGTFGESGRGPNGIVGASPATLDGGVVDVIFQLSLIDLPTLGHTSGDCHTIEFIVANGYNKDVSQHTPNSLGSDNVKWIYQPRGGAGCIEADAGVLGDGAFFDAPADALPLTPDAVGPL